MEITKDRLYAALTGDVIGSSKLGAQERSRLHDALLKAGDELRSAFPELVVGDIQLFRGDSLQFLVAEPASSLRAALFFRAALKASPVPARTDARLAIGIGTVDFVPEESGGGADGEAYRLSGPALDEMNLKQTLGIALSQTLKDRFRHEALKMIVLMVGVLAQRWTPKQALAVKGALLEQTQEEISRTWPSPVSRQAIAKNLDGGAWFAVESSLEFFEKMMKKQLEQPL